MAVTYTDAQLVLFQNKKIIALYDKSNDTFDTVLSLYRPPATGVQEKFCPVTIWMDNNMINIEHTTNAHAIRVSSTLSPNLFLDDENIVIGVGDMRNGVTGAGTFKVDLSATGESAIRKGDLVIHFIYDDAIEIQCNHEIVPAAVTQLVITKC